MVNEKSVYYRLLISFCRERVHVLFRGIKVASDYMSSISLDEG
jgi:hypothetical protein